MKNNNKMPKRLMEKLSNDLHDLLQSHEGTLLALQLLENLPHQVKKSLVANLSTVHSEEVAKFMLLIAKEYPQEELGLLAERSIKKLALAGVPQVSLDLLQVNDNPVTFSGALVSRTRLKGDMSLVLFFVESVERATYSAYFFNLSFGEMGIKEFFYTKEISEAQRGIMESEQVYQRVSFSEALYLLSLAHAYNIESESLPALGIFVYGWLLEQIEQMELAGDIYPLLWTDVTPEHLVNGLCLALRREDYQLVDYLTEGCGELSLYKGLLLHNEIISEELQEPGVIKALLKMEEEEGLFQLMLEFKFAFEDSRWKLLSIEELERKKVDWEWLEEALSANTETACYFLHQPHGARIFIESVEGMEMFQEGEGIDLYKWWDLDKVLEEGINFSNAVLADFLVSEDEMVIMANDKDKLEQAKKFVESNIGMEIEEMEAEPSFEIIYKIYDQDNMSFNELIDHWTLSGSTPKDQLNTWLTTKLSDLGGMTPVEASGSNEGSKMLWSLVKKIHREGKTNSSGLVHYHSLLKSVGWGKKLGKIDKLTRKN